MIILRTSALCSLCMLLASCQTPAPVRYIPTSEPFCAAVQTVCIYKDDQFTEPTAQQIEANNLGRAKVCKSKKVQCKQEKPTS